MNLSLSWALGIVHIYVKAPCVEKKLGCYRKAAAEKKITYATIALEHPLPMFAFWECFLPVLSVL